MKKQNRVILFLALVGLIGCATSPKKVAEKSQKENIQIIDAHLHTNFSGKPNSFSQILYSRETLEKEMKQNGVIGAISHTKSAYVGHFDGTPMNIVHCAGIDDDTKLAVVEDGLKKKKFSCIKIYLGYIHKYATHPLYVRYYKLAEKYNVPVVFHTGDTSTTDALLKYSEPMIIDEVAVKYRNVTFVIAHLGNPWVQTAAEIVYKNANVYADISAFLVGDITKRTPSNLDTQITKPVAWAFEFIEDPSKLMFGTDWPLTPMGPYIEAIKKAIPRKHWDDVFYKNAQRVFKIPSLPAVVDPKE